MRAPLLALLLLPLLAVTSLAQDPLVKQALTRIEKVEALEADLKEGDGDRASYCLNQLAWAGKRLNAVSDKTDAHYAKAVERYQALWAKIEAKGKAGTPPPPKGNYDYDKLVALNKEVNNAFENLKILSVKHLADENRVRGIQKEIAGFKARLAEFPEGDENVQIVAGNLANFEKVFDIGMAQMKKGQAELGGVAARLQELRKKYESDNRPQNLSHPFDEAQIRAWAAEMRRFREQEIPTDLAWLAEASQNPAADANALNNMRSWLSGTWTRNLNEVEKLVRERVASDVNQGQTTAEFILETDPTDRNQVLARILGKGAFDQNMTWLRQAEHAVAMARVYDDAMGAPAVMGPTLTDPAAERPAAPDRDAQARKVAAAITHLEQAARQALDEVRMPKAASTDPELLRIAEQTLSNPDYEVGEWLDLVINLDKRRKVRREAWLKPGTTYATLSYYEYVWDEYQVTTAEKVGDEIWLFSNRLKRYESGDPTTPVGRWILSRRFELTPILPENLDQDAD